jgi:hypothetical protein
MICFAIAVLLCCLQRLEPGAGGTPTGQKQPSSKAAAAARTPGSAAGEPQPHKQSRLAKQSSTTATTAAAAVRAAAAAAPASSNAADDDEQQGANKQQLVAVKQERLDRHDRQDRERKQQQQQQHAGPAGSDQAGSDRQGGAAERNPKLQGQIVLATGRGGAAIGEMHAVDHRRQQQQHAAAAAVYVEPPGGGQWRQAQLQLSKVHNFQQLLRQLQGEFPHLLPDRDMLRIKVVYQDCDGDWVMALPDQRWRAFVEVARKVLVCHSP